MQQVRSRKYRNEDMGVGMEAVHFDANGVCVGVVRTVDGPVRGTPLPLQEWHLDVFRQQPTVEVVEVADEPEAAAESGHRATRKAHKKAD